MSKKNVFGLSDNLTGLLCYLLFFISGVFFLIMEKENKTVRFHALQSIVWFGALAIISVIFGMFFGWIPLIGYMLTKAIDLISIVSWAYLMYTAFRGQIFKIPVIGDAVWEQVNR